VPFNCRTIRVPSQQNPLPLHYFFYKVELNNLPNKTIGIRQPELLSVIQSEVGIIALALPNCCTREKEVRRWAEKNNQRNSCYLDSEIESTDCTGNACKHSSQRSRNFLKYMISLHNPDLVSCQQDRRVLFFIMHSQ
jgi:hypothetical protein